jgi:dolichol kinase
MSDALALESRPVALQLHGLLRDLDPARWDGADGSMRGRIEALEEQLSRVLDTASGAAANERAPLRQRLGEIVHLLRERVPKTGLSAAELREAWSGFRKQLQQAYEALGVSLKAWSVQVPSLRPTNHVRNVFHMGMGTTCVVVIEELLIQRPLWLAPLIFACTFWFLEGLRHYNARARSILFWIFSPIAHPHERYRVNSSTWFATALVVIGLLFEPMICAVAVIILGLADPAAAVVGRRLGRLKLVNGRTVEGSATFVVVGALAATAVLRIWHPELSPGAALIIALGAAVPAALAELYSRRIDDNFSVPMTAAIGGWAAAALLGLG